MGLCVVYLGMKWTTELINALFPKHCRGSCSDKNPINGDVHYPFPGVPPGKSRCSRCMALQALEDDDDVENYAFDSIEKKS